MHPVNPEEEIYYPRILRRIRALLIDSIVTPVSAIGVLFLARSIGLETRFAILATALVVFILEPVLVSFTSGTVGHHINGLQIKSANTGRNLNLFASSIRYIFKVVLGLFSLILILMTKRHQAIHDVLSQSVVILKYPASLPSYEAVGERTVEKGAYKNPTIGRKVTMIATYNVALYVFLGVVSGLYLSGECMISDRCSAREEWFLMGLGYSWAIGALALIVLCWRGLMPGCRRAEPE